MATTAEAKRLLRNEFIRELLTWDLDPRQFVLFGSAPLLAHGLRAAIRDLDVVARGDVLAWARWNGAPGVGAYSGDPVWHCGQGRIQFSAGWITSEWSADDLLDNAEVVGGLRVARLEDVLRYKTELWRPKDLADIARIRARLGNASLEPPRPQLICLK